MPMFRILIAALLWTALSFSPSRAAGDDAIKWQTWSPKVFETAKAEGKLVILDLEAVWCHWCHVMEDVTYANETVREVINDNYIAVRADQAAHPGLESRYGDWGWPATIVFNEKGEELGKYRGFIPVRNMVGELVYYLTHREPEGQPEGQIEPAKSLYLSDEQKGAILKIFADTWDTQFAGWGRQLKFMQLDTVHYAMKQARKGDEEATRKVLRTLDAAMALLDPVWGGIYQYSDAQDWSSPHFEKIMSYQRDVLILYSQAYALWGHDRHLQAAQSTRRYLKQFLTSQDGAFFASQNADVDLELTGATFYALDASAREALGRMPEVDRNIYTKENGWAITGLLALYNVTADRDVLNDALAAARWVIDNRSRKGGGFLHGSRFESEGPFLGDNLAMVQAFVALYQATGDESWVRRAQALTDFIDRTFRHSTAGFASTPTTGVVNVAALGALAVPQRNIEQNTELGRVANLLAHVGGRAKDKAMAEHAMRYLASPAITSLNRFMLGIVLLDEELAVAPAHVTIVGPKTDPAAAKLHASARALPLDYYRLDWFDPASGPLPNPDVDYPPLKAAAAFACVNQICSLPIRDRDELLETVETFQKQRKPLLRGG